MNKYIRTTHDLNGKYLGPFSEKAEKIWHKTAAGFIGHLLNSKIPMSTYDMYKAVLEYDKGFPEEGPSCLSMANIQKCLDNLVKYNLAKIVD